MSQESLADRLQRIRFVESTHKLLVAALGFKEFAEFNDLSADQLNNCVSVIKHFEWGNQFRAAAERESNTLAYLHRIDDIVDYARSLLSLIHI